MANKELEKECSELIRKKIAREINGTEYYIGLIELDKKYPKIGFKRAAEEFANRWLRK